MSAPQPYEDDTPQRGPFCGECGESMQMEYCVVTGVKHEFMTLYKRRQVVEVDMGSGSESEREGSPENPLVMAFPKGEDDDKVGGHGGHGGHVDVGEAEQNVGGGGVVAPRVSCMGFAGDRPLKVVVGVCGLVFVLEMIAGVMQNWFKVTMEVETAAGNVTETTSVTYGLLRMCNESSVEDAADCGKVSIYSDRCNTDTAQELLTGAAVLYIAGVVFLCAAGVATSWLVFGRWRGFPPKNTLLLAVIPSTLGTLSSTTSPAISTFLFSSSYCRYDLCELLTWTWLQTTPSLDSPIRTGSCQYGPSLYLSWVTAGLSLLATSVLLCLFLLRKETHGP